MFDSCAIESDMEWLAAVNIFYDKIYSKWNVWIARKIPYCIFHRGGIREMRHGITG